MFLYVCGTVSGEQPEGPITPSWWFALSLFSPTLRDIVDKDSLYLSEHQMTLGLHTRLIKAWYCQARVVNWTGVPLPCQHAGDACKKADWWGLVCYTMLFPLILLHPTPPIPLLNNLSEDPGGLASLSEQRVAWSPRPALEVRLLPLVTHWINQSQSAGALGSIFPSIIPSS